MSEAVDAMPDVALSTTSAQGTVESSGAALSAHAPVAQLDRASDF